jgi:hypothetical protein
MKKKYRRHSKYSFTRVIVHYGRQGVTISITDWSNNQVHTRNVRYQNVTASSLSRFMRVMPACQPQHRPSESATIFMLARSDSIDNSENI